MSSFDEEHIDQHGECAVEINRLRDALKVARRWMPDRPVTETSWQEVATVNAALGLSAPPRGGVKKEKYDDS
jgi:hypothetical protein